MLFRSATEQAVRVLEVVEALRGGLVAAVGDEAVSLQQTGGTNELVGVPPEAGAARRAARAQDALVQAVEHLALLGRLQALLLRGDAVVDQVGLDAVVLLEEQRHVDYLKDLNCEFGQGFHYSRPLPAKDFEALLKQPTGR